jgi:predicted aldo/keto reductase-like oxidoreductase
VKKRQMMPLALPYIYRRYQVAICRWGVKKYEEIEEKARVKKSLTDHIELKNKYAQQYKQ